MKTKKICMQTKKFNFQSNKFCSLKGMMKYFLCRIISRLRYNLPNADALTVTGYMNNLMYYTVER